MLQLIPQQRLLLAISPIDFRKGINRIIAFCEQQLGQQPNDGTLFVFVNRKRTAVKILVYDGQGYWLCMKRFSTGKLKWWPTDNSKTYLIGAKQLQVLLYQGNPARSEINPDWHPVLTQAACS
jgi:transposase